MSAQGQPKAAKKFGAQQGERNTRCIGNRGTDYEACELQQAGAGDDSGEGCAMVGGDEPEGAQLTA